MVLDEAVHSEVATPPHIAVEFDMAQGGLQRVESCRGVWIFDLGQRRFCRVPADGRPPPATEWSTYDDLEIDLVRGRFAVTLNDCNTVLRSWFHVHSCPFCAPRDRQPSRPSPEPETLVEPVESGTESAVTEEAL